MADRAIAVARTGLAFRRKGIAGRAITDIWFRVRVVLLAAIAAGCGGGATSDAPGRPEPSQRQPFSRPLEIYRDMGFLTGPGQFPVVASFATMAGPADSAWALLTMSMPASALRFQRDAEGFLAEYTLDVAVMAMDSTIVRRVQEREGVRVSTFAETGRTDESIIYQQGITLSPGRYIVSVQAADVNSSRGFRMLDTLDVPSYDAVPAVAEPVLVYDADGRSSREDLPKLIANPRRTVAYGDESPRVYIESYSAGPNPLQLRVVDEAGTTMWGAQASLTGGAPELRYGVVEIPIDALPLGRFWVEVAAAGTAPVRTPLVLTISDQWMVANVAEIADFLRYIAYPEEIDSLQTGSPSEQRAAWDRFWARRDPLPVTPINEYRDQFFQRVRYATEAFREPGGRAGWDTDRGEVYIVLGPPDHAQERWIGDARMTGRANAQEWLYTSVPGGQLTLLFYDRTGFERFELIPSSESAFRRVAERLKPRLERN